jgi:two-component system sensor histidine kinase MprB
VSLRWKIALSLAAVTVVATILVGTVSYRSTSSRLVEEIDRSMAQAVDRAFPGQDNPPQRANRFPARGLLDIYDFQFVTVAGDVVAVGDEPFPLGGNADDVMGVARARATDTVTRDGEQFRVLTVGLEDGALQIIRSLDETDAVLDDLRARTVLLVLLVAVGAALVGWLIAGSVARPLRRLTGAAEKVERSGDLEVDLPAAGSDEVGRLTAAFRSMLDALSRSRASQQRLVQDAGHELRTPLTSLRTNLAVLRRHAEIPGETREQILTDLDGEVTELSTLVDELVAAASGQLREEAAERLHLAPIADQAARRVARRRDREVAIVVESDPEVMAPPHGTDRAVANLVDNACKFDETGETIDVVVAGGSVRVLDRGPGIPEGERSLVVERFHRTEAARAKPGSGLGLSIVHDIVSSHDGTLTIESRDGGGSDIGIRFLLA